MGDLNFDRNRKLRAAFGAVSRPFFFGGTTTNEISKWSYLKMCLKQEGPEGKEKIKLLRNEYNQVGEAFLKQLESPKVFKK